MAVYFTPGTWPSIAISGFYDCLFVFLSVCLCVISKTICQNFRNFLCLLPVVMAWSCSDDSATSDIPVLRMSSRFHIMGRKNDVVSSSSPGGGTEGKVAVYD